jgi:hypothetical protein
MMVFWQVSESEAEEEGAGRPSPSRTTPLSQMAARPSSAGAGRKSMDSPGDKTSPVEPGPAQS